MGDANAVLAPAEIVLGKTYTGEWASAVSVLPNASYNPWVPAASRVGWAASSAGGFTFYTGAHL